MLFGGTAVWLVSGPLGTSVVFLAAFFLARAFFGVIFLRDVDPSSWPDVRQVLPDTDEFRSQEEHFASCCQPWAHKYDFDLKVAKLYRASTWRSFTNQSAADDEHDYTLYTSVHIELREIKEEERVFSFVCALLQVFC